MLKSNLVLFDVGLFIAALLNGDTRPSSFFTRCSSCWGFLTPNM